MKSLGSEGIRAHRPASRPTKLLCGKRGRPSVQPTLFTVRLELRPFSIEDAPAVHALAGAREVADTTLNIPHPYERGMAEEWIESHAAAYADRSKVTFAVLDRFAGGLVGAIGLAVHAGHSRAELGYWIGVPFWNQGYATEAAAATIRFGFEELGLNRIFAQHFVRNPASGRVMQKLWMQHEGRLRQHVCKRGRFEDVDHYGLLVEVWRVRSGSPHGASSAPFTPPE